MPLTQIRLTSDATAIWRKRGKDFAAVETRHHAGSILFMRDQHVTPEGNLSLRLDNPATGEYGYCVVPVGGYEVIGEYPCPPT